MSTLDGRRVLVAGASQGIGRETALQLHRAGASVALVARTQAKLDAAVAECEGAGPAVALAADLRDEADCHRVVEEVADALGGLDAIVYSLTENRFVELVGSRMAEWQSIFATNVFGAAALTTAAVPYLKAARGHAIYLSSESALYEPEPWRGLGIYVASKLALESMARSFQVEVPEVAFTTLVVGSTDKDEYDPALAARRGDPSVFGAEWRAKGHIPDGPLLDKRAHADAIAGILTSDAWIERIVVRQRRSQR